MMPAGYHSDSDSTLLPLQKSAITWFGGTFARLPPLAAGIISLDGGETRSGQFWPPRIPYQQQKAAGDGSGSSAKHGVYMQ